ncbi:NlpC/P60 family protein [Streptomyces sp. NPDC086023]|uniref:C40 family peptidase n=1 Tax=Streptomyces sp. NPDC086023 TaxID=3365746 RepID=UPI0037CD82C4
MSDGARRGAGVQAKRWITAVAAGAVATPAALGLGVVMLVATLAQDRDDGGSGSWPTGSTLRVGGRNGVPAAYAPLILKAAAACPEGLQPSILAAQLWAESNFDPGAVSHDPAGRPIAYGIAQFIPSTWKTAGVDGDGDGVRDVMNPADAIPAQGGMMCKLLKSGKSHPQYNGSPIELALAGYNAGWGRVDQFKGVPPRSFAGGETYDYVQKILERSVIYTAPAEGGAVDLPEGYALPAGTPPQVRTAVAWALAQKGGWYRLGGDCTRAHGTDPAHWCDCSSLMQNAYRAAGIDIPRTTFVQIKLPHAVPFDKVKPGDLVFNPGSDGNESAPGHVGMFIGATAAEPEGWIIEAPRTGVRTRVVKYSSWRHSTSYQTKVVGVRRVVDW